MISLALLGIPYDAASSWRRGPANAPAAIRAEFERARSYSNLTTEDGTDLGRPGLLLDAGDVAMPSDDAAARDAITATALAQLHAGHRLLSLGGDHSVTWALLRAVHQAVGTVDVVHLDAHPDLYPEFEGNRFSHACPFARALEDHLIGRLVQVGIRTQNAVQRHVAERYNVEQVPMSEWHLPRLEFTRPVYVSLDLDVLDPAFAPGVSHPEPGGLSVREAIAVLQRNEGRVVAADLVEYNPDADFDGRTAIVAVKLLKELAACICR
jgi:agmatinase